MEWCQAPDVGLPQPDHVVFMDIEIETAIGREEFGNERYETVQLQQKVRDNFFKMMKTSNVEWTVLDGTKSIETLQKEIAVLAEKVALQVENTPMQKIQ